MLTRLQLARGEHRTVQVYLSMTFTVFGRDGNVRYYEYENDNLFALSEYKSSDPQRGMCFLPRRALNTNECEIARAYKIAGTSVEPIAFIVPRKVIPYPFLG